jgi:hypothetical protein
MEGPKIQPIEVNEDSNIYQSSMLFFASDLASWSPQVLEDAACDAPHSKRFELEHGLHPWTFFGGHKGGNLQI